MKRKQITAILMSAIMTVSACMPMSMPTLAAENAGASETAAAATVEAEPEAGEIVDPEPAPEITPDSPTGEEPGSEPQGTEPEDPAPSDDGEDNKEVSGDAATTSAEDEDSAIGATEGSTSDNSEISTEDPNTANQIVEDEEVTENGQEVDTKNQPKRSSAFFYDFDEAEDIFVNDTRTVSVTSSEPYYIFRFVPDQTGKYVFYSESSYDTEVAVYAESGENIANSNYYDEDTDFRVVVDLNKGEEYHFATHIISTSLVKTKLLKFLPKIFAKFRVFS